MSNSPLECSLSAELLLVHMILYNVYIPFSESITLDFTVYDNIKKGRDNIGHLNMITRVVTECRSERERQTFRKNILPSSSGSKSKQETTMKGGNVELSSKLHGVTT
jgi:hypothetical protein